MSRSPRIDMPVWKQPLVPDWEPENIPPEASKPEFESLAKTVDIQLECQPFVQLTKIPPFRGAYCLFEVPLNQPELHIAEHWECHYYICNEDGSRIKEDNSIRGVIKADEEKDKEGKLVKRKLSMAWKRLAMWEKIEQLTPFGLVEGKFYRTGLKAIYKGHAGASKESDEWFLVFGDKWKFQPPSSDEEVDRANRYYWPKSEAYDAYIELNIEDYRDRTNKKLDRLPQWPPYVYVNRKPFSYMKEGNGKFMDGPPNIEDYPWLSKDDDRE